MKMSTDEKTYCRLCAEPTPKEQLISSDEDVAITSKVATKMLWINVDITTSTILPTTICFSCFDLLERTWSFLHTVRTAQEKLHDIFIPKIVDATDINPCELKQDTVGNAGRPVDTSWEDIQKPKAKIKVDPEDQLLETQSFAPNSIIEVPVIKTERESDDYYDEINTENFVTSDSDTPLQIVIKKKKTKKKKKLGFDTQMLADNLLKNVACPLDESLVSWEDYMCRCGKCDALCKNIASLQLHSIQIHSCCCLFKCSECGKVSINFKAFVNHARTHKRALKYFCEYCNKQFSLTQYLKKHLNTAHRNSYITSCQSCGANFENEELLQDHIAIYNKGQKRSRKREKTQYDTKCEHCNKEFKSRSNLQQHKLLHTERSRNFSCHVCGKMFFTKGTLSTHMSTHEDMKPFKCEFCPLAFRARGNLQSHISMHSGVKPFVCEQCGKSFRVKRHLKSHSIVHTDLMPYICEFCNKPFRFKTRLNLHLRQHTGAKPYKCILCEREFTNGSNFKKHMKRRHNIDTSRKKYNNIIVPESEKGRIESKEVKSQYEFDRDS